MNGKDKMYYNSLIRKNYKGIIGELENKYGKVPFPYYTERNFLNVFFHRTTNNLKKQKKNRKKGLYIHHVCENKYSNLSGKKSLNKHLENLDFDTIKRFQDPKNLVYCDIFEHMILHAKCAEEFQLHGLLGFYAIKGKINSWNVQSKSGIDNLLNKNQLTEKNHKFKLTDEFDEEDVIELMDKCQKLFDKENV